MGVELLGAGLAVAFHMLGTTEQSDYQALGADAGVAYRNTRAQAERSFTLRNVFIYVTLAMHALNVFDALMSGQSYASAVP